MKEVIFDAVRHPDMLGGIRIFCDENLPTIRRTQVRFPRSKKVRIRKKFRKDPRNWRDLDATNDVYMFAHGAALMHPRGFAHLVNVGLK